MTDIIERIDELATERRCPHCGREWHELALTRRVAGMFDDGRIYSSYFTYEDTTPIVCHGSAFIGPMRQEHPDVFTGRGDSSGVLISSFGNSTMPPPWITAHDSQWVTIGKMLHDLNPAIADLTASFQQFSIKLSTWLPGDNAPSKCNSIPDELTIEFGPQNWLTESIPTDPLVQTLVSQRLHEFSAIETHAPEKRPYDFDQLYRDQLYKWQPIPYPTEKRRK